MASQANVQVLRETYRGYAPGTEFTIIREHQYAPLVTVSPVGDPFRGFTVPQNLLGDKQ